MSPRAHTYGLAYSHSLIIFNLFKYARCIPFGIHIHYKIFSFAFKWETGQHTKLCARWCLFIVVDNRRFPLNWLGPGRHERIHQIHEFGSYDCLFVIKHVTNNSKPTENDPGTIAMASFSNNRFIRVFYTCSSFRLQCRIEFHHFCSDVSKLWIMIMYMLQTGSRLCAPFAVWSPSYMNIKKCIQSMIIFLKSISWMKRLECVVVVDWILFFSHFHILLSHTQYWNMDSYWSSVSTQHMYLSILICRKKKVSTSERISMSIL